MEIANRIKSFRVQYGYTQETVADKIGVSRVTISNWEKGKTIPDIYNIIKLSELYNIPLERFLMEESVHVIKEVKPKAYSSPLQVTYGTGFHSKTAQVKAFVDLDTGELSFYVGKEDLDKIRAVDKNQK